jgi:hemolysin activation/secretion protein
MNSKNRFSILFSICIWIIFIPKATAQLPTRIERPKLPETPLPKAPSNPSLEIKSRPDLPSIDNFPEVTVKNFRFIGNTVISTYELQQITNIYLNKKISMIDLLKIRENITKLYTNKGYVNSGVSIPLRENTPVDLENADIKILVIEGKIGKIIFNGSSRYKRYLKERLNTNDKVFNSNELLKKIRLLEDDPLFSEINAKLVPAEPLNRSDLEIDFKPSKIYRVELFTDNFRSNNVGTFERGVNFIALNPLSLGDKFTFDYTNSNGSDSLAASYAVPVTAQNTTLTFRFSHGSSSIIGEPANILNIKSLFQSYFVGVRHPIIRVISDKSKFELGLGIGFERIEAHDSLLSLDFSVGRGSDNAGQTTESVLNFTLDGLYQDKIQYASFRSEIRRGVDFDNKTGPGFNRGEFLQLRGNGLWTRKTPFKTLFTTNLGFQFSDSRVIGLEQFSLGGISTIPGYPQDALLFDSGIFGGISLTKSFQIGKYGSISLRPFFNIGYGYNNGSFDEPPMLLAAPGVSLEYGFNRSLFASLTYAIPILDIPQNKNSLQNNGLSLSIRYVF